MNQRKPILFIHSSNELYGSDVVLLQIVKGLDRQHFEPIIVLPCDIEYDGKLSTILDELNITNYSIKMGVIRRRYLSPTGLILYFYFLLLGIWQLNSLINKHKIALVYSNTSAVLSGAFIARIHHLPHIWHIHEILEKPLWLGRLIYRFVVANSTKVIAISTAVAERILEASVGASNIQVIWNGVNTQKFSPAIDGQSTRESWGILPNSIVVGMIGRISHWKGQELFITAAAAALKEIPTLHFVIVGAPVPGDESRLDTLQCIVEELGCQDSISFFPFSTNAAEIMRAFDIFVLPSILPEPFGLVLVEAMASEIPVIASAHGGPVEIIEEGKSGLFFPSGCVDKLTEVIITLAKDQTQREMLARNARRRILEKFSLEAFTNQLNRVYSELLDKK